MLNAETVDTRLRIKNNYIAAYVELYGYVIIVIIINIIIIIIIIIIRLWQYFINVLFVLLTKLFF